MKKLTAGIFTVMLGLCATSGADAAVASQGYVDTKVAANKQSITELTQTVATNKTAAENAIAGEKSARETAVSGLNTRLTTAEGKIAQHTTDISAINAELDTVASNEVVTALQTQVGEGTVDSRIETAKQAAIDAAAADATTKANNALADAKADAEKYIDAAELATSQSEQNTAIETAYKAADKKITDSIGTVPADKTVVGMIAEAQTAATYDDTEVRGLVSANTNAISAINDAETGILAVAKKYADDNDADTIYDDTTVKADIAKNAGAIATLNGNDQTEGSVAYQVKELADGAVATNTTAIATLNGDAQTAGSVAYQVKALADGAVATNTAAIETLNGDDQTEGSVAKSIADAFTQANLSKYATTEAMNTALTAYELKSNLKALAYKGTVGTNDIDNLAVTTAKLADGAVESGKIANGAVTDEKISAVASSKVTGLSESLATKMDITNTTTVAGKYVFTANVGENGVTDYAWEEIARD